MLVKGNFAIWKGSGTEGYNSYIWSSFPSTARILGSQVTLSNTG